jgi:fumarate hydratase class II
LLESARLLADACDSFREKCIDGLELDRARVETLMRQSLMLVTALNPHIGYDNAAKAAKYAHAENLTLKEAVVKLGLLSGEDFERLVDPRQMLGPSEGGPRGAGG